ncbi:MAG: ribosome maturation factor RimP [Bdellovibrionales bacterium]|nr:ribosome maturation factor RimP [Bdellovibrionales bacterium]
MPTSSQASSTPVLTVRKNSLETDLIAKIEPVLAKMGYALRDIEVVGSAIVRVVLDSTDEAKPIGIDDCSAAHDVLSPLFDVWDPLPSAYTLEVSSPGEKPALRTFQHFQAAVGGDIKLETLEALPVPAPAKPRRRWEGTLVSANPATGSIVIKDEMGEQEIALSQIKDAMWLRDWAPNGSAKTPNKKKVEK